MRRKSYGFFHASRFMVGGAWGSLRACRFLDPVDQPCTSSAARGLVASVGGLKTAIEESIMNTKNAPVAFQIAQVSIRQDADGRYCLNDLHKAAGGIAKHRPNEWLRNQQAKELVAEIELITGIPATNIIKGHRATGTYVVKELVYAYAMWISAKFHLQVIRAYDAQHSQPAAEPSAAQLRTLIRAELTASTPAAGDLLPAQQTQDIIERLDRLGQMFHPMSAPFADVLSISRALRGLHTKTGLHEPGYRKVITHPADRQISFGA